MFMMSEPGNVYDFDGFLPNTYKEHTRMFYSLMLACIRLFDYTFFVSFVFTPLGGSRYEIIH